MSIIPLSKSEMAAWTRASTKAKQIKFLLKNGIKHHLDCDGWPVVLRSAVDGVTESAATVWKSNKAA